jgi:hypothetical protein
MSKYPIEKVTTPKGNLEWVNVAGEGKEGFNEDDRIYTASLVLDPKNPDHQAFLDKVDAFWEENKPWKKEAGSIGIKPHMVKVLDKDGNPVKDDDGKFEYEEDGQMYVVFKTATTYTDGKPKKIKIFNHKAREVQLPSDVMIGNDSIGQLNGAMAIYATHKGKTMMTAGVTFYLDGVKISKLEEYKAESGFDADEGDDEEGGWTGDEEGGWTGAEEANGEPAEGGNKARL